MAQGDLKKLLEQTRKVLMKNGKWFRQWYNLAPHVYSNSLRNVRKQMKRELGEEVYAENKKEFDKLTATYMERLYNRIVKGTRYEYTLIEEVGNSKTKFSVKVTPNTRGGIVRTDYENGKVKFDTTGADAFKRIINVEKSKALKDLLEKVNSVTQRVNPETKKLEDYTSATFLDTGHTKGGIAVKQTAVALSRLSKNLEGNADITELARSSGILARINMASKWFNTGKRIVITVTDESSFDNRSYGKKEKDFKIATAAAIQEVLDNTEWATLPGSDSVVSALIADFHKAAKETGGKVTGKTKADRSNAKVSGTIKYEATRTRTRDGGFVGKVTSGDRQTPGFDISLIALINSRLPPAVRANMGSPALQNQTGRFSESVKIVGVEQTAQGFPSLVYSYQRAPYDVFDPVLGSAPWASKERDPKPLITKSIRDVTREMAIGRFYTRRQ